VIEWVEWVRSNYVYSIHMEYSVGQTVRHAQGQKDHTKVKALYLPALNMVNNVRSLIPKLKSLMTEDKP
jgi:hypothetical protein